MNNQNDLGKKIAIRLAELDMRQSDLADAIGVSRAAIAYIVSGRTKKTTHINEIADVLQMPVDYLLGKEDRPPQMCHTMQAALMIKDKVNNVIIALAADSDINGAIKLCAEIMDDLEAEYL